MAFEEAWAEFVPISRLVTGDPIRMLFGVSCTGLTPASAYDHARVYFAARVSVPKNRAATVVKIVGTSYHLYTFGTP